MADPWRTHLSELKLAIIAGATGMTVMFGLFVVRFRWRRAWFEADIA